MAKDYDVTKNRIKFSCLWDKLQDPDFTTIRSWDKSKEEYYRIRIGQEFQVWKIKESYPFTLQYVLFHAWLGEINVVNPLDIPTAVLAKDIRIDGQESVKWAKKILKNKKVIVLKFTKAHPKGQQRLPFQGTEGERV
jgi:hypothetical protein